MLQRGPGEGYHAAKGDALALAPHLECRACWQGRRIAGYTVTNKAGRVFGSGRSAREAWGVALENLRRRLEQL